MEMRDLEERIKQLEEEHQSLVSNFKETASSLVERVQFLESKLQRPPASAEEILMSLPPPQSTYCPHCQQTPPPQDMHLHNFTCCKVPPRVGPKVQVHPLQDLVRAALQTDDLGKFKKLVSQGFPLDHYFQDSGTCTPHTDLIHEGVKSGAMKVVNYLRSQNVNLHVLTEQGDNVVVLVT